MKKLIDLPTDLKERLEEHKKKTGVALTNYILSAVYRQMIRDGMIKIKTKEVYINGEQKSEVKEAKGEKFCDSEKCEFDEVRNSK